jgi:hypothetical protein
MSGIRLLGEFPPDSDLRVGMAVRVVAHTLNSDGRVQYKFFAV